MREFTVTVVCIGEKLSASLASPRTYLSPRIIAAFGQSRGGVCVGEANVRITTLPVVNNLIRASGVPSFACHKLLHEANQKVSKHGA